MKRFCSKNRDKDTVDMRSGIDSIDSLNYVEETNKSFLATYFMKEELSDLKIHTENKKIPAHSFILMARSPVFKSLLKNNPRVIELEVGHFAVHHFLYFIYTFEYSIPNDTKSRFELLELLSHFEFIDFQKYLIQYIIDNLNEQNMIDVFEKSQKHGIEEIENQSYDFLIGLGDNLLNSDKFLKIKLKNVKKIISDDDLSIDEFTIFKTVQCYCFQYPLPDEIWNELVNFIRFPRMNSLELCLVHQSKMLSDEEILELFLIVSSNGKFGKTKYSRKQRNE